MGLHRVGHDWSDLTAAAAYSHEEIKNLVLKKWQGKDTDADTENRLVDTEREGKGGTDLQSSTETYSTICKTDNQREGAV